MLSRFPGSPQIPNRLQLRSVFPKWRQIIVSQFATVCLLCAAQSAAAHEGHQAATYEVTAAADNVQQATHLRLEVTDASTGLSTAARFTLTIDGKSYVPEQIGANGLRFVSIHQRKQHVFPATYSRGSGAVLIPLPPTAKKGTVTVTKGFEFLPVTQEFDLQDQYGAAEVAMKRWIALSENGWHSADEHLHYERTDPKHDADWLTMMDADGLSHAYFMVLRGGNVPGVWAEQFAYGQAGEGKDSQRLIRPGEEYRDGTQGHINLLGIEEVIQPISTGGIGQPQIDFNYPPLLDVYRQTHDQGAIGGPAHGGSLARSSTAVLDTVLGAVDFFEIANTHLYKTDVWYRLLNCGLIVPPVGGTDLPNFGFRDPWQPLLGEVRTYVRTGPNHDFEGWKAGLRRGEVFVTSGPMIRLDVNGVGPGGKVRLPGSGGEVTITAVLASPRPLTGFEIIRMGKPLSVQLAHSTNEQIYRIKIEKKLAINSSCWLAARGTGGHKTAVEQGLGIEQSEFAHTAAIGVIVGGQPIHDPAEVEKVKRQLVSQQEYYRGEAKFEKPQHRRRFFNLFEQAMVRLEDLSAAH